jgi:hypothetical protein
MTRLIMDATTDTSSADNLRSVVSPDGQSLTGCPLLTDLQTRFLFSFFLADHCVKEATDVLVGSRPLGKAGVWECAAPRDAYQEEALDHVTDFLFSVNHPAGCGYLKVSETVASSWFHGAKILLGDGRTVPIGLVRKTQVELFLSHYGVGVLSITLTPFPPRRGERITLEPMAAVEFNYRLVQLQPWSAARIRIPHPGDDPESLARLSDAERAMLRAAPPSDAPLVERVGKRGGAFTLPELVNELLRPLTGLRLEPVQTTFTVYSIARFGSEVDFGSPRVRDATAPFLSALAQVEEPGHAGSIPGAVPVANAVLNRRHRAAVGQLGAVHLIADQPDGHPFNQQRLPRVRDKYFIQYLMALLQKLVVHRAIDRAGEALGVHGSESGSTLAALRSDLLRFGVGGHFTQVSTRHALHRYYRLARRGLDVPRAWLEVRRAVADLDARLTQERQEKVADGVFQNLEAMTQVARDMNDLARKMDTNLRVIADVQRMVHWIEIFIVSVYLAHLFHMMYADNQSVKDWLAEETQQPWAGDLFLTLGVLVCAILGFGVASVLGKLMHTRTGDEHDDRHRAGNSS